MKTYSLRYEETAVAYFNIPAESEREAMEILEQRKCNGEIDDYLGVIGSSISVLSEKEVTHVS